MKKRIISLLLSLVMLLSLMPVSALAATPSIYDYFKDLPVSVNPDAGSKVWKTTTLNGETVAVSGIKGKSYVTSTLTLTFTEDSHLSFEYKVSSEAKYDKCTIKLGTSTLVNGESGDQDWKVLKVDAKIGDKLTVEYSKDGSGDGYDDCVYLRNFSAGAALVVTFHNGDDTYTQNIYGGKGTLKANTFASADKVFAGWATVSGGEIVYADGAKIELTKSIDLYAVWGDAYKVTFYNNGTETSVLVAQHTAIGSSRLPADPTRKGYIFGGWFSGDEKLSAETVIDRDITYTAKWTPIRYTIEFDPDGGEGTMDSISAKYDEDVKLPDCSFTRAGYTFNGWSSYKGSTSGTSAGEKVKNLTDKNSGSTKFYAAWKGLRVAVTVDPNYEGAEKTKRTGIVGENYNYIVTDTSSKLASIEDPKRTGYIFTGWFNAAEGGTEITTQYKFTADDARNGVTLYAHWEKGITVHFDGNGYKDTINDKTVTHDKVYSSLPYTSKSYYPAGKALDGWYIKSADGSFGEKVTKYTVFTGDEVTLIAKWRDYQYIIKYNIKYSDKSSVTGTMADQPATFGNDVVLSTCSYTREGYDFAGWAESSYGSTVKYADGATINRPFEEGDYWDDGSADGETYNLYAVWTENKSPEQTAAEVKLNAAEAAISGTYNAKYGTDTNALTMIRAKLTAAGITDVTVSMKKAEYSSFNYVGIDANGTLQYKWNENGSTPAASGSVRPTIVLSCNGYSKDSTECLFYLGLDEAKANAALKAVLDRISVPEVVENTSGLGSLPKYPLKAGVDESNVDYNDSDDLELWSTVSWATSDTSVISISEVSYPYFSPYQVSISQPRTDTEVTLTATIVYNGRDDLTASKVFTVTVKGSSDPSAFSYAGLLDKALNEIGLTDPRNGSKIDNSNVVSDIQFPTTKQLNAISLRDYGKSFDGKYTPILLCTDKDNVVVSADPSTANTARMLTYRPLPKKDNVTVTVTIKILDRPSGEGKDYSSLKVLASKDITLTVQPLTQSELDTASAFMKKVCSADVYWEGIRNANTDKSNVSFDMRSFIEIVPNGDGYKFIRSMDDYNAVGVKADEIDGWYASEQYRCFRSSVPNVVAHENLLVTQPTYNTEVTIDSVLSYTEYAKYYEKFGSDPEYAQFAQFYKQPISVTVTVIGTTGASAPAEKPITVSVSVDGHSGSASFKSLSGSYSCDAQSHNTAADALIAVLSSNGYSYTGSAKYITGVTDSNGFTLSAGDSAHGSWSGWMFTVNGEMPILSGDAATGNVIYATLATYELKSGDSIRFYYVNCPTSNGNHSWDSGTITVQPTCKDAGVRVFTCSTCGDTRTEAVAKLTQHTWNDGVITTAPTHASEGVKTFTCTVCGETKAEAVAKLTQHTWDNGVITTAPTHASEGVKTFTCTVCGETKAEAVAKLTQHTWDNGVITTAPTHASEGVKTFTCTVCGETMTETIAKLAKCDGGKDCPSRAFTDVTAGSWCHEHIDFVVTNGLFYGTSNSIFAPDQHLTRAMMVTVLWRAAGCPENKSASVFADVADGAYYAKAVAWAAENGVVLGTSAKTFSPNDNVTREQMAVILFRYAKLCGKAGSSGGDLSSFADAGSVSEYAADAMAWAVKNGIILGVRGTDGTYYLNAKGSATRAQAAAVFMRYANNIG